MDSFGAGLAGDHPGVSDPAERRCVLFGCLEAAVWIVSDPQGGELAACELDVDVVVLNDALGRVPLDRDIRVEVRRSWWRETVARRASAIVTLPRCWSAGGAGPRTVG